LVSHFTGTGRILDLLDIGGLSGYFFQVFLLGYQLAGLMTQIYGYNQGYRFQIRSTGNIWR
jgi:hypothetical protein